MLLRHLLHGLVLVATASTLHAAQDDASQCKAIDYGALLPNIRGETLDSTKVRQFQATLTKNGLHLVVVYRPVATPGRHGKVMELNPYLRNGLYMCPGRTVHAYVGLYPFVALASFEDRTVAQARAGVPSPSPSDLPPQRLQVDTDTPVQAAHTLQDKAPFSIPALAATHACADGGPVPQPLADRRIVRQHPAAGALIGIHYVLPGKRSNGPPDATKAEQALRNFPEFSSVAAVHLVLDCPRPPPPDPPCEQRCIGTPPSEEPTNPWVPGVLGVAAGAAIASRLVQRPTAPETPPPPSPEPAQRRPAPLRGRRDHP